MALSAAAAAFAERTESMIKQWQFSNDSVSWKPVTIPHDWAIYGPFDRSQDLQKVTVEQNGETEATWKTGRTGGLPYVGKGFYKTTVNIPDTTGRSLALLFDGAMSHAHVYVNGKQVAYWPYGYNSFYANLDGVAKPGDNIVEVSLENLPESSRWYPGAGLYRNVHLIDRDKVHIPVWGTYLTTPYVSKEYATVKLRTEVEGVEKGEYVTLTTVISDKDGKTVASDTHKYKIYPGQDLTQNFIVRDPSLWTPETPTLYTARTTVSKDGKEVDTYSTRFGIRSVEVRNGEGFFLNGEKRKFKGVCNHHDLGPLGAAVNKSALRHQLQMLKDMGADAVRTAHNMPTPELVELCDEMGLMMMIEPFDDWGFRPKCKNGYGTIFNEWAEKDMVNMLRHYRNNPSVVMWSIGNEVPSQWGPDGISELRFLQDIVHREDPTRPVTCGMDQVKAVTDNGFAAALDVPGFNYRVHLYEEAFPKLPQNVLLGSETTSTVSSRGKYYFPVKKAAGVIRDDNQSSSYDVEYCSWSNIPDDDLAASDDLDYDMGQFVWTGFDYLGEPSPYDTDAWPSHSSYFGIIDLASIPKDRYYLYRSNWNDKEHTLHILPHWNLQGHEGDSIDIWVYSNCDEVELTVNGKKLDRKPMPRNGHLSWKAVYRPGAVKAVGYKNGKKLLTRTVETAGAPARISLTADRPVIRADNRDVAVCNIELQDKKKRFVPTACSDLTITVSGPVRILGVGNGNPAYQATERPADADARTCQVKTFNGLAQVLLQSTGEVGEATLTVVSENLPETSCVLKLQK